MDEIDNAASRLYDLLDVNQSGKLTCDQLCTAMKNLNNDSNIDLKLVFQKLDKLNNGFITKDDFINGYDQFVISTANCSDQRSIDEMSEMDRSIRDTFDEGRINELVSQFNEMRTLQKQLNPLKNDDLVSFDVFFKIYSIRLGYNDIEHKNTDVMDQLKNVFLQMDNDNDGYICEKDFLNSFGNVMTHAISQLSFNSLMMDESWDDLESNRSYNEIPNVHFSPSAQQNVPVEHFVTEDSSTDIHTDIVGLKREIRDLRASNLTISKRSKQLEELHQQVIRENELLHTKLKMSQHKFEELQDSMNKLQDEYDTQVSENQGVYRKLDKLKKEIDDKLEIIKDCEKNEDELRQQVQDCEKQVIVYETKYNVLHEKHRLLERAQIGLQHLHQKLKEQQNTNSISHGGLSSNSLMNMSNFSQSNENLDESIELDSSSIPIIINPSDGEQQLSKQMQIKSSTMSRETIESPFELSNSNFSSVLTEQTSSKPMLSHIESDNQLGLTEENDSPKQVQKHIQFESLALESVKTNDHRRMKSIKDEVGDELELANSEEISNHDTNVITMSNVMFKILMKQQDFVNINWCDYFKSAFFGFIVIILFPFFGVYFFLMNQYYKDQHHEEEQDCFQMSENSLDVVMEDDTSHIRDQDELQSDDHTFKKAKSVPANLHISSSHSASNDLYQLP